ncbi:protein kinase domain-containing protein [Haematococcus lacustris]|uniref:Protein kinase domain-containing protein n=1 Tax=Haematococcus lacustris TaxID=44745 RepID=A0A699YTE9_HAELA|nr:protein kinase domain-containing protein [Haematococcus lacustris]
MIAKQRDDRTVAQHLQCIQAEVEAWSSCQGSQYVVRLEGLYEDAEHVMLVQELCSGGDLRSVLKRGQLTEFETAQVMRAVLDVVHECHSQGILYGDVFMAPEQWQGGSLGLASDIWAAGVMMYQLLSGRFPFWADVPAEQVDGQGAGLALYKVVCAIQSNPVLLTGAPWDRVSRPCKDLLCAMLDRQPSTRISAHAALHHSWFRQQLGQVPAVRSPALQPEQSGTYDPDDYSVSS